MNIRKDILWRVYLVYAFVLIGAGAIMFQAGRINLLYGEELRQHSDSVSKALINVEAVRGNIYSTDGSLMATSIPTYEIRVDMNAQAITNEIFWGLIDSLAYKLSIFPGEKSQQGYRNELVSARRSGDRYHLIIRKATFPELKVIQTYPLFNRGRYKGGLIIEQRNIRKQPFGMLAARTLGYQREGYSVGIEGAYNEYLGGVSGKRLVQKVAGGVWLPVNDREEIQPEDGFDIVTTIDVNIQDVAQNALLKQLINQDADHGSVVLMEVATGQIKAIANLSRLSPGVYSETYNYAIGESTEPGSTFKLASIIAALEDGYINIDDSIQTGDGTIEFYDMILRDTKEGGYGMLSIRQAFEYSSNVAIAKIIQKHYGAKPDKFIQHLYDMHLDKPLDVKIAGEGMPRIKDPSDKYWSGVSLPYISVGYEVTMTPLQMLTFYNAIANNGRMVAPQFVKEINQMGKTVKKFPTRVIDEKICSDKTLKIVRELLEGVVANGTANNLSNTIYTIAGKTGTAQIATGRSGYKQNIAYQASFAGYFPAENPKYSCIVVVAAPSRSVYYGNLVAGPIFREIADKVYSSSFEIHDDFRMTGVDSSKLKIPLAKRGSVEATKIVYQEFHLNMVNQSKADYVRPYRIKDNKIELYSHEIINGLVPNVVGMGLKDALFLLENEGLKVNPNGYGRVTRQSIPVGTRVNRGEVIILDLSS